MNELKIDKDELDNLKLHERIHIFSEDYLNIYVMKVYTGFIYEYAQVVPGQPNDDINLIWVNQNKVPSKMFQ